MTTIKTPGRLKLVNATEKAIQFVPYKENFATTILAGNTLVLGYETVGQYFYYMKQAALGLTVEAVGENEKIAETDTVKVISVPSKVTVTNTNAVGGASVSFIPYRENFWVDVAAGESYEFDAKTAGQCIYYLNQATEALTIVDAKETVE